MKNNWYIIASIFCFLNSFCAESSLETKKYNFKRAIVIGATSGMGRAVAKLLANDGYVMGLVGRRENLLKSLQEEIPTKSFIKQIDVSQHDKASEQLKELIEQMGGLDLILISVSSYADIKDNVYSVSADTKTLNVDLVGFWVIANTAVEYFEKQKSGHLVGISSISGLRGSAFCPVYCGAKAFISKYLEGIRNRMLKNGIQVYVTDIVPGWVDVEHTTFSAMQKTYWVASLEDAARQIYQAIREKKKIAYITKRQIIVAWLLATLPDIVFNGIGEL